LGSSDLHLEATEIGSLLRIRIDGLLQQVCNFGKSQHKAFLGRIKLLAGLKLNVEKKPQDGRFTVIMPSDGMMSKKLKLGSLLFPLNMEKA